MATTYYQLIRCCLILDATALRSPDELKGNIMKRLERKADEPHGHPPGLGATDDEDPP